MKFKIKAMALSKIINFANITTKHQSENKNIVSDLVIDIRDGALHGYFVDEYSNALYGKIKYDNVEVVEEGIFGIFNLSNFSDFIKSFDYGSELTIYIENNKLIMERASPYKKVAVSLLDENTVKDIFTKVTEMFNKMEKDGNIYKSEKFVWDSYAVLLSSHLRKIVSDTKLLESTSYIFPFELTPKEFKFKLENEDKTVQIEAVVPTISIKTSKVEKENYSYGVDGIFTSIDGKIKLFIGEGKPIIIERIDEGDGLSALYIAVSLS